MNWIKPLVFPSAFVIFYLYRLVLADHRNLRLTLFDVGQGDAILLEYDRKSVLIDGGGGITRPDNTRWCMGEVVLLPELARKGLTRLDHVIMTHPDQDHAFGLFCLLDHIKVDQLWFEHIWGEAPFQSKLMNELWGKAQQRRVAISWLKEKSQIRYGPLHLDLLPFSPPFSGRNDNSLVSLVEFAGCRILLTGDIEKKAEEELTKMNLGQAHVLKVAHHGSRTSSGENFIRSFSPQIALISVGRGNTYGHPHPTVTQRLREFGVSVLRTDFHGFIELSVTPAGVIHCRTGQGECGQFRCH